MFNVGGGEILVVLLVALIVLGPQRLPGTIRQVGQFMGEIRKMSTGFQRELKSAFDEADRPQTRTPPPLGGAPNDEPTEATGETSPEASS